MQNLPALHKAAKKGDLQKIEELLEANAIAINEQDQNGRTAMHYAAKNGNLEVCKKLASAGIDIDAADFSGLTSLYSAVKNQDKELTEFLINSGSNVHFVYGSARNIMDRAKVAKKHTPFSKWLKNKISYPKDLLESLSQQMSLLISESLTLAKSQGKQLLVMLGECHGEYPIQQAEDILLKIASNLGIKKLLIESDTILNNNLLEIKAREKLGFIITPVDMHPERLLVTAPDWMFKRNVFMTDIINRTIMEDSVFITGSAWFAQ
ncbi:MAG TPA: ankyrin repeat domain-containing protein [Gammaproteobacteria bacterium]|nr:ankyrin repeat domain-containing protein [Gammaproteobacteria bacterium]